MYKSFDDYLDYLKSNRDQIPAHLYNFISNPQRHDLNSPGSLHDSWLESLTISESRDSLSNTTISLKLLGQQHDRYLILTYYDVITYNISGNRLPFYADTYHGDVQSHEIRITNEGYFTHRLEFATESMFFVTFENFSFEEKIINNKYQ